MNATNDALRDVAITPATTVVASTEQVSCELPGEVVILSLKDGTYYGLNRVAAHVWELIQEPRRVGEIRDALLREYEVEEERCTTDLVDLLAELHRWELVEVENPDG